MGRTVCGLIEVEFSSVAQVWAKASSKDSLLPLLSSDAIIDFSNPQPSIALAQLAIAHPAALPAFVIGTTGWEQPTGPTGTSLFEKLSQKTPVLMSANFSIGVFIFSQILKNFAPVLRQLHYTPILTEVHHSRKKDAPSGTALALQRAMDLHHTKQVQTHSIRAGEVVGEHEVRFFGIADELQFSHKAYDRSIFARGSIEAALWLTTQRAQQNLPSRILTMDDYYSSLIQPPSNQTN
jgi:4-hydroxy-tetrahydrodipicolinate reductase